MSTIAFDQFALTRIADFARSLSRLHQASRRQSIDDDAIEWRTLAEPLEHDDEERHRRQPVCRVGEEITAGTPTHRESTGSLS